VHAPTLEQNAPPAPVSRDLRTSKPAARSTKNGARSPPRRGRTIVTIAERAAVLGYFADREEFTALLQTMAECGVRAGVTVAHDSSAT
jgi:hypothetical protein